MNKIKLNIIYVAVLKVVTVIKPNKKKKQIWKADTVKPQSLLIFEVLISAMSRFPPPTLEWELQYYAKESVHEQSHVPDTETRWKHRWWLVDVSCPTNVRQLYTFFALAEKKCAAGSHQKVLQTYIFYALNITRQTSFSCIIFKGRKGSLKTGQPTLKQFKARNSAARQREKHVFLR